MEETLDTQMLNASRNFQATLTLTLGHHLYISQLGWFSKCVHKLKPWQEPSEEKVRRRRISCWTNQLHLIHGKPVGSPYCFLIVSPGLPPPSSQTPPSTALCTSSRNKGWFVHLYIQLQWIILTTKELIDQKEKSPKMLANIHTTYLHYINLSI